MVHQSKYRLLLLVGSTIVTIHDKELSEVHFYSDSVVIRSKYDYIYEPTGSKNTFK